MKATAMSTLLVASSALFAATPPIAHFTVDDVDLRTYQDAGQAIPAAIFPEAPQTNGPFRSSCNVFLVIDGASRILVDSGNGAPRGSLAALLERDGVAPGSITDILVTHEHHDHLGGLLEADGKPAFTNATLHMWWPKAEPRAPESSFRQTYRGYRLNLFADPATARLPAGFTAEAAAGHTPHHVFFRKGRLLFIADAFHAIDLQFDHPELCAKWDADRDAAVKVRRTLLDRAARAGDGLVLCGAHIPFPGAGSFSGKAALSTWHELE